MKYKLPNSSFRWNARFDFFCYTNYVDKTYRSLEIRFAHSIWYLNLWRIK